MARRPHFQHSGPLAQAITWYGWTFIALIGLMSVINLEGPIAGLGRVPPFVLVMPVFIAVGVVLMVLRYREGLRLADEPVAPEDMTAAVPGRGVAADLLRQRTGWDSPGRLGRIPVAAWACLIAATAMFGYAILSTQFTDPFIWVGFAHMVTPVPRDIILLPLLNAMFAMWAGFVVMAVTPRMGRLRLLWWMSLILVPLSVAGWLRVSITKGAVEPRLWTQMGGSAVYPVVLILALGVALAGFLNHFRPRVSLWMAVIHLVLVLLTGSRGGLLMIGVLLVLMVLRLGRQHTGAGERLRSLPPKVYVLGGVAVLIAVFASPILGRLQERSAGRLMTWRVGVGAWDDNPAHIILGLGSGTLWPWFAYESGWQPHPWPSRVTGPFGYTLYHSHSLYLNVLAELGIIGLLLLAAVVWPIAAQWLKGGRTANVVVVSAVCACLVGFAFDLFLFKNFPISLVWWTVVFGALLNGGDPRSGRPPGTRASHSSGREMGDVSPTANPA